MDEEDDLTNQLEQEQEQALESAIQEEETWLKELAREENTQIEVETETETESDLGVRIFLAAKLQQRCLPLQLCRNISEFLSKITVICYLYLKF